MFKFLKEYLAWRKLRRDLLNGWNEKFSRVAIMLEIERHQKELFFIDAEIAAKQTIRSSVKTDLELAQNQLKQIESWNG